MEALLIPILARAGAPVAKSIIEQTLGGTLAGKAADGVIDVLSHALGVDPTPEAIKVAYDKDPVGSGAVIAQAEADNAAAWTSYLTQATAARDELLKREDAKGLFYDGWRPALSWLLIWLVICNSTLVPIVNGIFGTKLPITPWDNIISFAGIWLVIYGGGHTVKSVFGKK